MLRPATPRAPACTPTCSGLQPYVLRPATLFAPACNPTCPALHPHQERVDSLTFIRSPYWLRNNLGLDVAVTVEGQGGGGAGSGHGREPAAVPQGETRELKVGVVSS